MYTYACRSIIYENRFTAAELCKEFRGQCVGGGIDRPTRTVNKTRVALYYVAFVYCVNAKETDLLLSAKHVFITPLRQFFVISFQKF